MARRDEQLFPHEVEARDFFRDRVLDLESGVHFEEVEGVVGVIEQELDRARRVVPDGADGFESGGAHCGPNLGRDRRAGRLLDHFLVATLDRALPLETVHEVPVLVAEHLDLDVTRCRQVLLEEDRGVAERVERLTLGTLDGGGQAVGGVDDPHALAASTGRGLDEDRVADGVGLGGHIGVIVKFDRRERRDLGRDHEPLGLELVAHGRNGRRRRPDPGDAGVDDRLGEGRVLGQEAVAGVDGVGPRASSGVEHLGRVEVGLGGRTPAERNSLVGLGDEGGVEVTLGVDGDGLDAHRRRRAEDAPGDLAPIGDQQPGDLIIGRHRNPPLP